MTATISNFSESGHADEHGRWSTASNTNDYSFRIFFTLSGEGFSGDYATYVIAMVPAEPADKSISTRAHLHMKATAAPAAFEHMRNVFAAEGPKAVSELKQLDLRGRL
jgi:hypothetical protein